MDIALVWNFLEALYKDAGNQFPDGRELAEILGLEFPKLFDFAQQLVDDDDYRKNHPGAKEILDQLRTKLTELRVQGK